MINFNQGKINLDDKHILTASDYDGLDVLTKQCLIEKREDAGGMYYYVEVVADGMRLGIFVSLRESRIEYLILRWLDGPCTSKGWDGVNEKALNDEYRLLLNFVEEKVGRPPDKKGFRQRTWRFTWGHVDVSYESRDFVTQIYMTPR